MALAILKMSFAVICCMLGAALASGITCLIDRRQAGEPWVGKTRSHCSTCGHTLNVVDLIPILGYIIRKGKCHYCGAAIPSASFKLELVMGIVFGIAGYVLYGMAIG